MYPTLFLLVGILVSFVNSITVINVDYRTGVDNASCFTSSSIPCQTLMYTLLNGEYNNQSTTTIAISDGTYNLSELIELKNLDNFVLSGEGIDSTFIVCDNAVNGGGLQFTASELIVISNVTFNDCGQFIESSDTDATSATITFDDCKDVTMIGVRVSQSLYSAAKYNACQGTLIILDSYFTDNGLNNDRNELICINGGAVSITIANNNTVVIVIESSQFTGNSANSGGAIYIETAQTGSSNITITNSVFMDNIALPCETDTKYMIHNGGTGGAISLFDTPSYNNNITIIKSMFTNNTASSGAGVQYHIWSARSKVQQILPVLSLVQSTFDSNIGNTGCAIVITPINVNHDGFLYWVQFEGNIIIDNIIETETTHTGLGTVLVGNIMIMFTGINEFIGNEGSSLVLLSAILQFGKNSETSFVGNTGFNGGAIHVSGQSSLQVDSNNSLLFRDNLALNKGGAIYHYTQDTIWNIPRICFIIDDTNETSKFTFENNTVRKDINAIYSNDVSACKLNKSLNSLLFCQHNWFYGFSDCSKSVNSEPVDLIISNLTDITFQLFPGVRTILPVTVTNIFGTNVTEDIVLVADTDSLNVTINPATGLISNNRIELFGNVNTSGELYLQTNNRIGTNLSYNIQSCPPGFLQQLESDKCECVINGFVQGTIICNSEQLTSALVITNCISQFEQNDSKLVAGTCPFLMSTATSGQFLLPQDPSKVEELVCGQMNRHGVLCGKCKQGYSPAAYSYLYECVKCDNKLNSWMIYLVTQYLPIVLFFLIVTFLNLTIVSPASNVLLFFVQVTSLSNAYIYNSFVNRYALGETVGITVVNVYSTINGIWNLDFFRAFVPPICLFENQNAVIVVFLDYLAAFFPFILVIITYLLIVLYNKNVRLLVWLWKPFQYCLNKVHDKFQSRTSLVDVFVTFFFLSYAKIVATTFRFLQYVFVYDIHGNILEAVYFYDGSIKLFQGIHLPFGILAIISFLTVVLFPPILLTFWQFKWFQKILEKLHLRNQALVTFVEVIQSGFTDGRDGTKDRRFFAGFYFILRIILFGPTTVIPQVFIMITIPFIVYTFGIIVVVIFQPYQNSFFNKLDVIVLLLLIVGTFAFILSLFFVISGAPASSIAPFMYVASILSYIPLIYMLGYVLKWFLTVTKICKCNRDNQDEEYKATRRQTIFERNGITSSLFSIPDRIIQPEIYQSLIITKKNTTFKTDETSKTNSTTSSTINSNYVNNESPAATQHASLNLERTPRKYLEMSVYSH